MSSKGQWMSGCCFAPDETLEHVLRLHEDRKMLFVRRVSTERENQGWI